ncbi:MAG: malate DEHYDROGENASE, NAD-dependent, partial [Marteilia pararefringens]
MKLSLIGSNGAIGQPLALLLAQSSRIAELSIYDIVDQQGVAMDLDHIDRDCRVESSRTVEECIRGSEIVVLSAGVPRKPGMTRDDLFQINASIVADISKSVAKHASSAFFAIITNPVNSNVPIACKVFEKCGQKSTDKIFGVTTLDIMRANTFIGKLLNKRAQDIFCPIVGGHSGETIIPLFSKAVHRKGDDIDLINSCNQADLKHLESQIQ